MTSSSPKHLLFSLWSFGQRLGLLMSEAAVWDGSGQEKGRRQRCAGGSGAPGAAEGIWKWGKWEGEQVLEDCEGPVSDSQVGKQASLFFLKNNLVLLYCITLNLSKRAGSLLQPTNRCHHPSLTGDDHEEVTSKIKRYYSS